MKFDQHVANYHRQLNEAAIGDFFRALTKNPEKLQQVPIPSLRLENPKKNIETVYQKLNIANLITNSATSTTPPTPDKMINPVSGNIDDEETLAVTLYTAFKTSNDGIVTLDQLIRGKTIGGEKSIRKYGEEPPYDTKKTSDSITKFIQQKGLGNIIKMYDSYESAQKGSKATQLGSAIQKGAIDIGKQAWNMATKQGMVEI